MQRFWAILMMAALVVAPCAVAHASHGPSSVGQISIEAAHNHIVVAAQLHHASRAGHKSGTGNKSGAGLSSANGLHHGSGDSGGEQSAHDCLMNCQGWLSASSPYVLHAIASLKSDVVKSLLTPLAKLFSADQLAQPLVGALPLDRMSAYGDLGTPAQISILNQTARRRI